MRSAAYKLIFGRRTLPTEMPATFDTRSFAELPRCFKTWLAWALLSCLVNSFMLPESRRFTMSPICLTLDARMSATSP